MCSFIVKCNVTLVHSISISLFEILVDYYLELEIFLEYIIYQRGYVSVVRLVE